MSKVAFAVAAHPDDIEFMMAGTLLLLGQAGYELHLMTLANGSCGSATLGAEEIAAIRREETRKAAELVGVHHHAALVDDLEIYYTSELVRRVCAVVRQVGAEILLVPSPQDYMEDHTNTSRLMVTAAFCRNMRNFLTIPPVDGVDVECALYHCQPYGLIDQVRKPVVPDFYVDVESTLSKKRDMLACHVSQKEWLDASQGIDSYIHMMEEQTAKMGEGSEKFKYAEGFRRHSHMGFGSEDFTPLETALAERIVFVQ